MFFDLLKNTLVSSLSEAFNAGGEAFYGRNAFCQFRQVLAHEIALIEAFLVVDMFSLAHS